MPKGLTFLFSLALVVLLALPAAAGPTAEPGADTVVARVNGETITLGHIIIARATLPQQYRQLPADVLYNAILDQLIQQTTLVQARTGDVPQQIRLQLENERRSLLAADEIELIMAGAGSEADVRAAYDARYSSGFGDDEFHAAHILVETEAEAKAIKAELDKGADFASIARQKSTGPTGPGGGDLGWFGLGAMVPEFEAAIIELETGAVSAPVQTQFGWHVITLKERRKSMAPDLETVREELIRELRAYAVETRIEELTVRADIERPVIKGFSPELILDLNLVGN